MSGRRWDRPDPETAENGLRAARAILAVHRGPRGARTTAGVSCPWCGVPPYEPCVQPATQRPLIAMHPARLEALNRRDDHLDEQVPWPLPADLTPDPDPESEHP